MEADPGVSAGRRSAGRPSAGGPPTRGRAPARAVAPALLRYRVMALVVGTLLVVLCFVAVPLKYLADIAGPTRVIGTAHGFLYAVFLLAAFDLALRARWTAWGTLKVLVAGTIPVVGLLAERIVTRKTHAGERI